MEQATENFVTDFMDGKDRNPTAEFIFQAMLTISRNVDLQNQSGRPREISRNMTALNLYLHDLREMYPEGVDDDELDDLLRESAR